MTLRSTISAFTLPTLLTIVPVQPTGTTITLSDLQSWELDSQADPATIVFSHQGIREWPALDAVLSGAKTVQQDLVWTNDRPYRAIARNPKVVTLTWTETLPGSAPTNRSATGLLEMLSGSFNVNGTVTRSLKFWRADKVYAYNNATPYWSAP